MAELPLGAEAVRCSCGAVTVEFADGTTNSMFRSTFRRLFPGVRTARGRCYGNCDHCVNHWGIDLCACGSGAAVGKCDNSFRCCREKRAYQTLGIPSPSIVQVMAQRGGFS